MTPDDAALNSLRQILTGALAPEPDLFTQAVEDTLAQGEEFASEVLRQAIMIGSAALITLTDGEDLDADELAGIAADFTLDFDEHSGWVRLEPLLVNRYLRTLDGQEPLDSYSSQDLELLPWVVAGWLVTALAPEDGTWEDALEELYQRLLDL